MKLFVSLNLLFLSATSYAANVPTISVSGNVRTRTHYIVRLVEECLSHQEPRDAQTWSSADLNQCVMNSRLFAEVTSEIDEQQVKLSVKEKWTLIPIPVMSASSGKSRRAGALLLESNFMGVGMNLAVGGFVSNTGNTYIGFLADPSLFFTNWSYNLSVSRQVEEISLVEGSTEDHDGFKEKLDSFSGTLGYRFKHWNIASSTTRVIRDFSTLLSYAAPEDNASVRSGLALTYDGRNYKLYFSEGLSTRLNFQREWSRSDEAERVGQYEFQASWQNALFQDHALQILAVGGLVEGGTKADAIRLGGGRGLRGIEPRTAWAGRYYAAAIDYQIPIKTYSAGTMTTAPFVDLGHIEHRGGNQSTVDFYTVGGGLYFFLKDIALPGIGFEAGFNSKYMGDFFTLSAGLSM